MYVAITMEVITMKSTWPGECAEGKRRRGTSQRMRSETKLW